MILNHIAQRSGTVVVPAATLDADRFRGRDLHVVDIEAIPDRFEHDVCET